jgi:hypothetical protein
MTDHEAGLYQCWMDLVSMCRRQGIGLVPPRWERFREAGQRGFDWFLLMEDWERDSFRGEPLLPFETFVGDFVNAQPSFKGRHLEAEHFARVAANDR